MKEDSRECIIIKNILDIYVLGHIIILYHLFYTLSAMKNDRKKFVFLVVWSIICVALVWWSIMSDWNEKNTPVSSSPEPFQATTQSVKNNESCTVSVFPSWTIGVLESVEITLESSIWKTKSISVNWNIVPNSSLPQIFEKTFLETGTQTIQYEVTWENWEKADCEAIIVVA